MIMYDVIAYDLVSAAPCIVFTSEVWRASIKMYNILDALGLDVWIDERSMKE